jgi:hypothetical protein
VNSSLRPPSREGKNLLDKSQEAIVYFSNPANCREYVVPRRWPNAVECPRCGSKNVTFLEKYNRWQCSARHDNRQLTAKTRAVVAILPPRAHRMKKTSHGSEADWTLRWWRSSTLTHADGPAARLRGRYDAGARASVSFRLRMKNTSHVSAADWTLRCRRRRSGSP